MNSRLSKPDAYLLGIPAHRHWMQEFETATKTVEPYALTATDKTRERVTFIDASACPRHLERLYFKLQSLCFAHAANRHRAGRCAAGRLQARHPPSRSHVPISTNRRHRQPAELAAQ